MKNILIELKQYKKALILGPLFKLFEAVLELFVPLVMAALIDNGIRTSNRAYVLRGGGLLLLLGGLCVGAALICQYYAALVSGKVGKGLRNKLYRHVMTLSSGDIGPGGPGSLITRLTADINQAQTAINMAIRLAIRAPFLATGSVIMAILINPAIGMVFVACTMLIVLILYLVMKFSLPGYAKIQDGQDQLSRLSGENLEGVRVIRAFSRQRQEIAQYRESVDILSSLITRVGLISAALNPLTMIIVNATILIIIWMGAGFAYTGSLTVGEVIALVNYMNQTLQALIVVANLVVLFTRALASAKRLDEVMDIKPSVVAEFNAKEAEDGSERDATGVMVLVEAERDEVLSSDASGDASGGATSDAIGGVSGDADESLFPMLRFENVSFAYHSEADDALSDINLTIEKGRTVGLIGGTGSGKSTIVNLITRFYDPGKGRILLYGRDIKELPPEDLRSLIGLTPQRAVLFSRSIGDNLRFAAPRASDEDLWRALDAAQASEFVKGLPEGLDSPLEEGGRNLSGGQRQRLTIARAIARKPRLLILDDAASALDYATDAALRKALAAERRNNPDMAVLIISQRVSAIKNADIIYVLDDGSLVGAGGHDELLSGNEVYREICSSQGVYASNGGQLAKGLELSNCGSVLSSGGVVI